MTDQDLIHLITGYGSRNSVSVQMILIQSAKDKTPEVYQQLKRLQKAGVITIKGQQVHYIGTSESPISQDKSLISGS
jgi:predicted O-methyltransferase YrrM